MNTERNISRSRLKLYQEYCGKQCVNCGSDYAIEYHHIVPLHIGGTDQIRNIVPLCSRCHKAVHMEKQVRLCKSNLHSGRSRIYKLDQRTEPIMDAYANCEIGKIVFARLLGLPEKSKEYSAYPFYREYMEKHNIVKIHNIVDCAFTNRKQVIEGDMVGKVHYKNGIEETKYWHDTGMNDCEYTKREIRPPFSTINLGNN